MPHKRRQPALYAALLCALLMVGAQALAYAHLHSADHAPGLECSACTLAKNPLVAAVDTAAADQPLVPSPERPHVARAPAPADSSTTTSQARAPPGS